MTWVQLGIFGKKWSQNVIMRGTSVSWKFENGVKVQFPRKIAKYLRAKIVNFKVRVFFFKRDHTLNRPGGTRDDQNCVWGGGGALGDQLVDMRTMGGACPLPSFHSVKLLNSGSSRCQIVQRELLFKMIPLVFDESARIIGTFFHTIGALYQDPS